MLFRLQPMNLEVGLIAPKDLRLGDQLTIFLELLHLNKFL